MRILTTCLLVFTSLAALAQPAGTISTVAGGGVGDGGPALSALLKGPLGVALAPDGTIYVADTAQGRVRKIAADGTITTLFTGPQFWNYATFPIYHNGPASCPTDIVVAPSGDVIFSDPCRHRIHKIDSAGVLSVIAGNGVHTTPFDPPLDGGPATAASLVFPTHLALDTAGNLYITEPQRYRIRRIAADGIIHHFAGATSFGSYPQYGPIAVDPAGVVHVFTQGPGGSDGNRIRRYSSAGTETMFAGSGATTDSGDGGPAASAGISKVNGMAFDASGNLVLVMADRIRRITGGGTIEAVATIGGADAAPEAGTYLVAAGDRLMRVTPPTGSTPVAGVAAGVEVGTADGIQGTAARLAEPVAVTVDPNGVVYIADRARHHVRKIDTSGVITTIAGSGTAGFSGDGGAATSAQLSGPTGLVLDSAGNLYIADKGNHRIRRVDGSGTITTVAGNGTAGSAGDGGPATAAQLSSPSAIDVDGAGRVLIADTGNRRVRRFTPGGNIDTYAGGGTAYVDRFAPPVSARSLGMPVVGIRVSGDKLYIATGEARGLVIVIDEHAMATAVVDRYHPKYPSGTSWRYIEQVTAVERDNEGNLIVLAGPVLRGAERSESFTVVAGGATCVPSGCPTDGIGDGGPAAEALLQSPESVFLHAPSGYLYLADADQQRVRKVQIATPMPSAFTIAPVDGASMGTLVTAAAVTPAGYQDVTTIAISAGGEYSVGCTGTFTSAAGNISPGQSVCVRQTSPSIHNATGRVTLTVGGRAATFAVTTVAGPGSSSISATSLDFGAQSINTRSEDRTLTLTNSGANAITLNDVIAPPGLTVSHDCSTIAAGASCTVTVRFAPRSEGALTGTLTLQVSSGSQSVAITGIGERSLSTHYYRSILGREPDSAGKAFWDGEAARAASLGANPNEAWYAMAATFFSSPEYRGFNRTDSEYLTDLYRTFFDRLPDAAGLAFWQGQLDAGIPREMLVTSFTFSQEFRSFTQAIFGTVTVRPEVDMVMDLYRGYLYRLPDDAGFGFWVGKMRAIQCSSDYTWLTRTPQMQAEVEAMTQGFTDSAEYTVRGKTNAQFLADTYAALFRRGADVPGFNFWLSQLAAGVSRDAVRKQMIDFTPEFLSRVSSVAMYTCLR